MSRTLTTSIALSAMLAMLAAPLMAQDAATPAPAAPAATAEAPAQTVTLPQALTDAGLTDVTSDKMRRGGTRIRGTLPDGQKIGAMLAEDGSLRGLRSIDDDVALPQALIDQVVPQAVRDNAVFSQLSKPVAVFSGERGVMLAGEDAQGNDVRAAFAQDGTLVRFGRGDDDMHFGKRDKKDHDEMRGRHGRKGGHDDDHERRGKHGWDRDDDDDHDGRRGPAPEQQGALPMAPARDGQREAAIPGLESRVDPGTVRLVLTEAGYSGIGEISQRGQRVLAMAVNPEGEPVAVELDGRGEVLREINR